MVAVLCTFDIRRNSFFTDVMALRTDLIREIHHKGPADRNLCRKMISVKNLKLRSSATRLLKLLKFYLVGLKRKSTFTHQ